MGLKVTTGQMIEFGRALEYVDIGRREDFRNAGRAVLVSRRDDMPIYDHAFDIFWRTWTAGRPGDRLETLVKDLTRNAPKSRQGGSQSRENREGGGRSSRMARRPAPMGMEAEQDAEQSILALYSPGEVLRHKDFSQLTQGELDDARRFLNGMRWTVTRRRSLRTAPARRGRRFDIRRSVRRSLRHGGEMLDLARRGPKLKRRPLVLLCDISGSMDRYTRLLLHFLHSIEVSMQRGEVFVFGTRLTRLTRQLRNRDPDLAIAAAAEEVHDWSGGTRIGEALHTFNSVWARRVLGHGAIVLIISDGWDRGDPELLAREMERLQRQSYRLLWLNPLLGSASYQPLTQGIRAALPYVDDFLPVHSLASLEALADLLNRIQEGRPERRRQPRRSAQAP
jgi:uncharacterized protein